MNEDINIIKEETNSVRGLDEENVWEGKIGSENEEMVKEIQMRIDSDEFSIEQAYKRIEANKYKIKQLESLDNPDF